MGEYLLRTNALTKEFGRHKAVNKVNLHVKKGSIYGFIGRNGADDYVTKPFDIKEIVARVEVQLRRRGELLCEEELSYHGLKLDKEHFCVMVDGAELSKITKQEFAILELLLKHPKKVFSKEEIFEYAWDDSYMGETKTLDVHISHIRKKIKEVTEKEYIETVWGIGYRLYP